MDSAVLIVGGAQDLVVAEDGCGTFWGSPGPYLECRFLAPVQDPQPADMDPSPTGTDLLASTADLWAFPMQIHEMDLHESLLWAPGLQLDSRRTLLWGPGPRLDFLGL